MAFESALEARLNSPVMSLRPGEPVVAVWRRLAERSASALKRVLPVLPVGSAMPSTAIAAMPASAVRIAVSLAAAPIERSLPAPIRTVVVARASALSASPWYQITVRPCGLCA